MKSRHAINSIMMEWYLAVLLMVLSSLLLTPIPYFSNVVSFIALHNISSTTNWGIAGIITAAYQMIALKANWYIFGKEARFLSVLFGIGFWSLLLYSSFQILQPNVAWLWYGSYVAAWFVCGISQIRAWSDSEETKNVF